MSEDPAHTVGSVERAFAIAHALEERGSAGPNEIAEYLDLSASTVHKHLTTLQSMGYVSKRDGKYTLGIRFLTLGGTARNNRRTYRLAGELVTRLAEEVGERVQFVDEVVGRAIYIHTEGGQHTVNIDRHVGKLRYLHSSAAGKAILASLPEQRVDQIIDQCGLPAETENTIRSSSDLKSELADIRSRGFAYNDGESVRRLRAVGVPVTRGEEVLGSFSVSAPRHRLKGDRYHEEVPNIILGYANELELKLLDDP